MNQEPSYGALFLLCLAGASALIFLFWLNHKIRTRGDTKNAPPTDLPLPIRRAVRRRSPIIVARLPRTERTNATGSVQGRSSHQDARSGVQQGANVQGVQGEILPNSREELQALIVATQHKRDGKSKQESIERAFNIKKGGSDKWRRASDLFDVATEPASRYRQYSEGELAVLRRQQEE